MKTSRNLFFSSVLALLLGAPTVTLADMDEMPMGKEPAPQTDSNGDHAHHKMMQDHDKKMKDHESMMKDHENMMSQHPKGKHSQKKMKMEKDTQDSDQQMMDHDSDQMKPDAAPNKGMAPGGMNDM